MASSNGHNGEDPQLSYFRRKEIALWEILEKLQQADKLLIEAQRCYARNDKEGHDRAVAEAHRIGKEVEAMQEADRRRTLL